MNGLITLGARRGHEVTVEARGPDAAEALAPLEALVADNLGDPLEAPGAEASATGTVPGAPPPARRPAPDADEAPMSTGSWSGCPAAPGLAVGAVHHLGAAAAAGPRRLLAAPPARGAPPRSTPARHRAGVGPATSSLPRTARWRRRPGPRPRSWSGPSGWCSTTPTCSSRPGPPSTPAAAPPGRGPMAVQSALTTYAEVDDAYLAERAGDLDAVGREVLASSSVPPGRGNRDGVVVADDLSPAQTAQPRPRPGRRGGHRGRLAHGPRALIARALGLPAVVAAGPHVHDLVDGAEVVVDGDAGPGRDPTGRRTARRRAGRGRGAARPRVTLRAAAQAPGTHPRRHPRRRARERRVAPGCRPGGSRGRRRRRAAALGVPVPRPRHTARARTSRSPSTRGVRRGGRPAGDAADPGRRRRQAAPVPALAESRPTPSSVPAACDSRSPSGTCSPPSCGPPCGRRRAPPDLLVPMVATLEEVAAVREPRGRGPCGPRGRGGRRPGAPPARGDGRGARAGAEGRPRGRPGRRSCRSGPTT
jgi:hypothetical protein